MDEKLKVQQKTYDQEWRKSLEKGKEEQGNLKTNLEFLTETKILKEGYKILEIGCGIGSIVHQLSGKGYDITGTDISQEPISYGLKKYSDIKLQVQSAEKLEFENNSFDVVLSFDLFEHIVEVDRHISEVSRVLKAGGFYLFQTPNKYSNTIFKMLQVKSLKKWRILHPSLHSPGQLKKRMNKHGFQIKFVKMNIMNEFTAQKLKKLGPLGSIIKCINFRKFPLLLQTNLYIIAHKMGD